MNVGVRRLRPYVAMARSSLQVGVAYRLGFFFTILGNLLYLAVSYHLWRAVYRQRTELNGLTFDQAYLYVALGATVFVLLKCYTDWELAWDIREGTVAVHLARPLDLQLSYLAMAFGTVLINLIAVTLPTVVLVFGVYGIEAPSGRGVWLFPAALLGAFVVNFCFDWIVGLCGFVTESIWGLSTVKETLLLTLSGAMIPLAFFPNSIERVLEWLPFQAVYHAPLGMLAESDASWSTLLGRLGVQLAWAVGLWVVTRLASDRSLRELRIAGG